MKWLIREPKILSGLALALLMVVLGSREPPASRGLGDHGYTGGARTPSYIYTGPSGSYAATPHVGSLTYSMVSDAYGMPPASEVAGGGPLAVASGEAELDPRARVERR